MVWNWEAIRQGFVAYGPRAFVFLLLLIGVYAIGKLMKAWTDSRRKPAEKSPDVVFLESALEDDAPRIGNPNYSYAEFQRDLHDRGLTFEEIYEKCGGVFPKKPEEQPPSIGPDGQNGYLGLQGQDGGSFVSERQKELQSWFKKQGEDVPIKKLVAPPPAPHTVIHKIYTRGRR